MNTKLAFIIRGMSLLYQIMSIPLPVGMVVNQLVEQICKFKICNLMLLILLLDYLRPNQGVQLINYTVRDYIDNELNMAEDLSNVSPLSVTVNANIWQDYRGEVTSCSIAMFKYCPGGIIRYHCTNTSIDHAVQVVGYDMTSTRNII